MAGYLEIFCGIVALMLGLYYYLTSTYNHWESRGVVGPKPVAVFGNVFNVMIGKQFIGDFLKEVYDNFKDEPMIGIFMRKTPILLLKDPELIKDVLITDFTNFAERGLPVHERAEPLSIHLFNLEAKRWRPLRTKLSPVFTSGKLKEMYGLIVECANHLEKYMEKIAAKNEPVECREVMAKYTTDVIGNCAFGLDMNALSDEDCEFRRMGRQIFQMSFKRLVRFRLRQMLPRLYDILGYLVGEEEESKFFTKSVMDTIEYRKKNNIVRKDFINVLMDLEAHPEKLGDIKVTDRLLAAQAFVFFLAGFETSSSTMGNALYELALNQKIQDKLRQEIRDTYEKCNGDIKYEDIKGMVYLDAVFREVLRKHSPGVMLMRKAMESYTFKGTNVTIPKGQIVWIPMYGLQHDPDIFPNPEEFIPERFMEDPSDKRHPMHYLPFGDGPRNCIGARFAAYQTKIGLVKILRNFKVDKCEKTMIPYEHDPRAFLLIPKYGIHLKVTKVDENK